MPVPLPLSPRDEYRARYVRARQRPSFATDVAERTLAHLAALATSPVWMNRVGPAVRRALVQDGQGGAPAPAPVEELVCYCLGDLDSEQVIHQLAFLLLLASELRIPPARRLVFDPVHLDEDRDALRRCGCTPVAPADADVDGGRRVRCRTLFYMPFAPFSLTDNVVRANWAQLDQVVIAGNSFDFVTGCKFRDEEEDEEEEEEGGGGEERKGEEMKGEGGADGGGAREDMKDGHSRRPTLWSTAESSKARAPCVNRCGAVGKEVCLWDGDFETWLTEDTSTGGGASEAGTQEEDRAASRRSRSANSMNCNLVCFPPRAMWTAAKQGVQWGTYSGVKMRSRAQWDDGVLSWGRDAWADMASWSKLPPPRSMHVLSKL